MFRTTSNSSQTGREERLVALRLRALAPWMLARTEEAAQEAISTRRYKNRTGNLTNSTIAYTTESSPNSVTVNLDMGMPYASFIVDGTYGARGVTYSSLSNFPQIYEELVALFNRTIPNFASSGAGSSGFVGGYRGIL